MEVRSEIDPSLPYGPLAREDHDRLSLSFYDDSLRTTQDVARSRGINERDYAQTILIENDPSALLEEIPEIEFAKATLLGIWRNHHDAMMRLADTGYQFTHQKNNAYLYFDAKDNWHTESSEQVSQIDRDFKLHLMPYIGDIPQVTQDLLEALDSDEAFGQSVLALKVLTKPRFDARLGKVPAPEIVIYPHKNVEAISTALAGLEKYFGDRPGRNIAPRYNVPVFGSSLLYMAEGHGHEKVIYSPQNMKEAYDPHQNYAFRIEDGTLVAELFRLASEKLEAK